MELRLRTPRDYAGRFSPGKTGAAALQFGPRACIRSFPSTLQRCFQRRPRRMSQPSGTCPNCGAKIVFRWSSSVQTVCEYCKSILVRTDVDLKKVGQVADLPPDSSPIQIGTEGSYNHKAFTAIGRIIYEYEQGGWNEWHLMLNDGTSGWLSDAQDEYAISFAAQGRKLPDQCRVGDRFVWDNEGYQV